MPANSRWDLIRRLRVNKYEVFTYFYGIKLNSYGIKLDTLFYLYA